VSVLPTDKSYVPTADADAYFADTPRQEMWDAIGDEAKKTIWLQEATRWLETLTYHGVKCDNDQPLKWPRKVRDDANIWIWRPEPQPPVPYTCDALPKAMVEATCELALALQLNPQTMIPSGPDDITPGTYVRRQKLGDLSVEYAEFSAWTAGAAEGPRKLPRVIQYFPWVKDILHELANTGGPSTLMIVKGSGK